MNISDILVGVNSSALNVPLNHTNWLLDYKINGQKSYVYKDKDILHELYKSPISANDDDIKTDAFNYFVSEEESYLGRYLSSNYSLRGLDTSKLKSCQSIIDIISDPDCLSLVDASEFANAFYELNKVTSFLSTTEGLKIAASNETLMTRLESSSSFRSNVGSNPDIKTVKVNPDYTNSGYIEVSNAFVLSMAAARSRVYAKSSASGYWYKGSITTMLHGTASYQTLESGYSSNSFNTAPPSNSVYKFLKSGRVYHPYISGYSDYTDTSRYSLANANEIYGTEQLTIQYIQLDNVV